ncbi:hypothetical protein [Microcoleus sp. Pol10D4]
MKITLSSVVRKLGNECTRSPPKIRRRSPLHPFPQRRSPNLA